MATEDRQGGVPEQAGGAAPFARNYVVCRVRVAARAARRSRPLAASTGNYVVPLDLNKRVPDPDTSGRASASDPVVPWYHANRMLSFYAPGWCGVVRDVIYTDSAKVTVVYRVTIRGTDGEMKEAEAMVAGRSTN